MSRDLELHLKSSFCRTHAQTAMSPNNTYCCTAGDSILSREPCVAPGYMSLSVAEKSRAFLQLGPLEACGAYFIPLGLQATMTTDENSDTRETRVLKTSSRVTMWTISKVPFSMGTLAEIMLCARTCGSKSET